jgi:hypothetical protein
MRIMGVLRLEYFLKGPSATACAAAEQRPNPTDFIEDSVDASAIREMPNPAALGQRRQERLDRSRTARATLLHVVTAVKIEIAVSTGVKMSTLTPGARIVTIREYRACPS